MDILDKNGKIDLIKLVKIILYSGMAELFVSPRTGYGKFEAI
ncbi:hypothetical protein QJR60_08480 [Paraclostridium sordellii]